MNAFDEKYRARFERLSTTNLSDAMEALGYRGATYGIRPLMEKWNKLVGPAVTVKLTAAGLEKPRHHLGVMAIESAEKGDVIVIDNGGKPDISCWGGILANGAKARGVGGVFIDGACRDLDDCAEIDFPVYARGTVVATARGRAIEEATNVMIQFGGVQVRPGDIAVGDRSGVVIVPSQVIGEVLAKAEALWEKEDEMIRRLRDGESMLAVDTRYNYEKMLKRRLP